MSPTPTSTFWSLFNRDMLRAVLAEFLATCILVLVGCGSVLAVGLVPDDGTAPKDPRGLLSVAQTVQVALAFGLIVASLAQAIGHVSGCHVNPSVTLGLLVMGKIGVVKAILYVLVQLLGGIVGAAILQGLTPSDATSTLGTPQLGAGMSMGQGFGVELFITFVLVLVVCGVSDDARTDIRGSAPLAVGLAITAGHLLAINYTGSAMNPARAFGPAVVSGTFNEDHWVYWVGPLLGGLSAGVMYRFLFFCPETTIVSVIRGSGSESDGTPKISSGPVFITNVG